jgi:outer membrane protein assembly factor BamB
MKKTSTAIMLIILCSSMFCALSATIPTVKAATAQVFVDPSSQTVNDVGDSFTVNVSIANVTNLYAYSFELYYDPNAMNGTSAAEGSFLTGGFVVKDFNDHYNSTYGRLSFADTLTPPAPSVSGSGVLTTIQFKSVAPADSSVLHLANLKLSDPSSNSISATITDGAVTVVAKDWWPMFHRQLTHTGNSASSSPNNNQTLWTYPIGAPVLSSPTVANSTVYVGSDKVYAINASTGVLIWSNSAISNVRSSPAVSGGMVFVGSDDGYVYALDVSTGNIMWQSATGSAVVSSPAVAGGMVFVGSEDNSVYALNEMTGVEVWNYATLGPVGSSPAVSDGMVFVGSNDTNVYALDASSGALSWAFPTGGAVFSSPAVAGGMVFVGSDDGYVYALDQLSGTQVWKHTAGGPVGSSPAVDSGVVFVGSNGGNVSVLDASDGLNPLNYTTGSSVVSSPAVASGMVFAGSDDGSVYAWVRISGAISWSYSIGFKIDSSPAVAGGRVFVCSSNGTVYAFGPPLLVASISPDSVAMDIGQSQLFTSNVIGGTPSYTYQWYLNGTIVSGATSTTWTFMPVSSGNYTVYLNVADNVGLSVKSNTASAIVGGVLNVIISPASVTIDVGQSQLLTSSVIGGTAPYSYQWCLNGAPVLGATSTTWTFTPVSSGSYNIYLNVTDNTGFRVESNSASVTVAPALSARVYPTTVTMGVGQSQLFASSVSGGIFPYYYRWYLNGVAVSEATGAKWTFTPSFAGTYTVYVKVNDALGMQATSDQSNVTVVAADWWPMFHHDLTHSGYSSSTAPNTNQTLWTYTIGTTVFSSPAIVDGRVYVGSGRLYCLNASTGSLIWSYATGAYIRSSPAVTNGIVYACSDKVYALNASTGVLIWSYIPGGQVHSSPAVVDGRVYVGSSDCKVYALDASTGVLVWSFTTGAPVVSSPVVAGGVVYIGSEDNKIYALNEMTGAQIWNYPTGNLIDSSPALAGGILYVASLDDTMYALNVSTGTQIWNFTTGSYIDSTPAVAGGIVYVDSYDGTVYALNASTGVYLWSYKTGGDVYSSPAVAGGMVFVGSYDNIVHALNASTGAPIWNYTTGSWVVSSPAVAGGIVYVGSYDGNVYAFGIVPLSAAISPSSVLMDVGMSQLFTSSVTGGISPYIYQWCLNDSQVPGATGATWSFTPASSGPYTVYLNVTDNLGLTTQSNVVSVTVSGEVSTSISPDNVTMDIGQSKSFTATVSGGILPYAYQWYLNGVAVSGATSSSWTFTPLSAGFYNVYVNVTDNGGLKAKSNVANVTVLPALSASISPTSVTIGVGQYQVFTSSVSGGLSPYSYQWYLNGGPVSGATGTTYTFTPLSAGSYTVYLKVSDSVLAQATSNTATVTVTATTVDWWSMFHHDLAHLAYSNSTAPLTNQIMWTYTTGSAPYSSPAVINGRVYVGSDKVYCLNASTGALTWSYATGGQVYSSPAVAGGIVYVGSDMVYALDASTGVKVWSHGAGGQVYSSPAVSNGIVYVGSLDGTVYALNASTGASVWNCTTGSAVYSSPAVTSGLVYVGSYDGYVYCLNASTGSVVWTRSAGGQVYSSPAVAGGVVYVGSLDHNVYALDASTGVIKWTYPTGSPVYSSPAVNSSRVYVASYDHKIYCLNSSSGAQIWNFMTGSAVDSSPALAGGVVYVGSDKVYCLNAFSGALVWSYATGADVGSSPAVANGVVFVGSYNYKIYAFTQMPLSAAISPTSAVLDIGMSQLFTSTITGGTPPYTCQWYLNTNPVSGATNPSWTFTPSSAGSYSVYLKVTDSASTVATSNIVSVTVNGPLSMSIAPSSSTIGSAQPQLFTSTVSGGTSPFTYQWYLNGTAVSGATSSTWTFTPGSIGSYNVYANVTDNFGLKAKSNTATVTVTTVSATIAPTSASLNVGQSQLFTSSISGGASPYSYQWYVNDTLVSGATSSTWTFTPSFAGTFKVYVTVTDSALVQTTSNTATLVVTTTGGSYTLSMYTVGQGSVLPGNGTYASGANVDIKAITVAGWLFAGWSGSVTGLSNMTIVMSGNMFVTATFTQGTFGLTMYIVGQGSVQPGNGTYPAGASVNITAITGPGWAFQGWSGGAFGVSNTTIVMGGNMFVTATFTQVVVGHDVAVTNIASDKASIGQGFFSNVTVTIGNLGSFAETFNVTVYANQTVIDTFVNTALASGNFRTLSFTWSTSGFAKGNYTISAYAGPVPGDVNTTNNYLSSRPVAVTIIGDLNGDFKVSLADLVILANAYGSKPGDAKWNPNADIDGNGAVSLTDLVNLAINYQGHFP